MYGSSGRCSTFSCAQPERSPPLARSRNEVLLDDVSARWPQSIGSRPRREGNTSPGGGRLHLFHNRKRGGASLPHVVGFGVTIRVLFAGKPRDAHWNALAAEYIKRAT